MNRSDLPMPNLYILSPQLQTLMQEEIDDHETLLWLDQPNASKMAKASWPIVLFGIPWMLFCCVWMGFTLSMAISTSGDKVGWFVWAFPLFGLPFVGIGLGMLSSPLWMRKVAQRTAYALTDQRAIIITRGMRKATIKTYKPDQLGQIERTQHDDGSGDLIFEKVYSQHTSHSRRSPGMNSHRVGGRTTTSVTTYGFKCIANVKAVEDLIEDMIAS